MHPHFVQARLCVHVFLALEVEATSKKYSGYVLRDMINNVQFRHLPTTLSPKLCTRELAVRFAPGRGNGTCTLVLKVKDP